MSGAPKECSGFNDDRNRMNCVRGVAKSQKAQKAAEAAQRAQEAQAQKAQEAPAQKAQEAPAQKDQVVEVSESTRKSEVGVSPKTQGVEVGASQYKASLSVDNCVSLEQFDKLYNVVSYLANTTHFQSNVLNTLYDKSNTQNDKVNLLIKHSFASILSNCKQINDCIEQLCNDSNYRIMFEPLLNCSGQSSDSNETSEN